MVLPDVRVINDDEPLVKSLPPHVLSGCVVPQEFALSKGRAESNLRNFLVHSDASHAELFKLLLELRTEEQVQFKAFLALGHVLNFVVSARLGSTWRDSDALAVPRFELPGLWRHITQLGDFIALVPETHAVVLSHHADSVAFTLILN